MNGLVDLHTHVLPGVDDGARDLPEAVRAVESLEEEGVRVVVATPHLDAFVSESEAALQALLDRFGQAHAQLEAALEEASGETTVALGAEVRLNAPEPDFADPRIRLAGSDFVLVEFPGFRIPPFAESQLRSLLDAGWRPVLAHAERHLGIVEAIDAVERWKRLGVCIQMNARSLTGGHGDRARRAAGRLLGAGLADYLASDFHARGSVGLTDAVACLEPLDGGHEAAVRLTCENPTRLLAGEDPLPVGPLAGAEDDPRSGLRRLFGA